MYGDRRRVRVRREREREEARCGRTGKGQMLTLAG